MGASNAWLLVAGVAALAGLIGISLRKRSA
jgi:LPXTG-motif cell wall-anchored protein